VVQFKHLLGLDTVLLGFGLPDENAHAPDEFLNLENFFGGIRTSVHFFHELPNYMNSQRKGK
jgi:acetylornithine deacetylase/succinyl-diaminopimelate desuccinylase-like protein